GTHTVTANVTHDGTPVAGQPVAFAIGGNNEFRSGTCAPTNCVTDANGNVTFTYTASAPPGADTIYASTTLNGSTEEAAAQQLCTGETPVPIADNAFYSVQQNTPTAITLQATGQDGNPGSFRYSLLTQPTHGTLSGTAPNLTYTPNAGYLGRDSFK